VVVGIDAGGTSVRVLVAGAADAMTGEATGPADSTGGPGPLPFLLERALAETSGSANDVRAVCAGVTKVSRPGVVAAWETELTRLLPNVMDSCRIVVPDFVIAFEGALGGVRPGIAVIAGTGSVVYGENETGDAVRVGGRGWEFGDEGSGAHLTADLMRRTLRALDGLADLTPLRRAVCVYLDTEEAGEAGRRARERAEQNGRGFLVPLVLEQARAGDREARNLFVGAGGWLALQVKAAAARLVLDPAAAFPVATVGGLWEAGDLLIRPFANVLSRCLPRARISAVVAAPVHGAVLRARRALAFPG
jgi:N-acetylglucosamine kinase